MSRFDPDVLEPDPGRRGQILQWLEAGLEAVDPARLTKAAVAPLRDHPTVVIALGKAAPAMARGAASILDLVGGVCVSDHREPAPDRLEFLVGDHPVPGPASLKAAESVLETARNAPPSARIIGLISGGGSALCEAPREGVPTGYLSGVTRRLIAAGADIEEINLVRAHLSAIKCGGVTRAAGRAIDTFVISDVAGADPGVVASGPTIPRKHQPDAAANVMSNASIEIPDAVWAAMSREPTPVPMPSITLLADGRDAARAVAAAVSDRVEVRSEWLTGDVEACLDSFLETTEKGVAVGVGETVLEVTGEGRGGRNTHAALIAADRLAGSGDVFVAFATDGVDGSSRSAGAIVDGSTVRRGGDPRRALGGFDSATYLEASGDLLKCSPTGTNVSDIWILWRRDQALVVE